MNPAEMEPAKDRLLAEFPPVGYEEWHRLVETELKGVPFDKRMLTATWEGITLKPIYRPEDTAHLSHLNSYPGFAPFVRGTVAGGYACQPWAVSQEITCSSPAEFNHEARNSLAGGLNALNMVLDKATRNGRDPDWAKPLLVRMAERGILESDIQGRYRVKSVGRKGKNKRWVAPDIAKILQEGGVEGEGENVLGSDDYYEEL